MAHAKANVFRDFGGRRENEISCHCDVATRYDVRSLKPCSETDAEKLDSSASWQLKKDTEIIPKIDQTVVQVDRSLHKLDSSFECRSLSQLAVQGSCENHANA